MCRSRRELSNAYLLAKCGVDTAEITRPLKFASSLPAVGRVANLREPARDVNGALAVDGVLDVQLRPGLGGDGL